MTTQPDSRGSAGQFSNFKQDAHMQSRVSCSARKSARRLRMTCVEKRWVLADVEKHTSGERPTQQLRLIRTNSQFWALACTTLSLSLMRTPHELTWLAPCLSITSCSHLFVTYNVSSAAQPSRLSRTAYSAVGTSSTTLSQLPR